MLVGVRMRIRPRGSYGLLGNSLVHASGAVGLLHLNSVGIPGVLLGLTREPALDSVEHDENGGIEVIDL